MREKKSQKKNQVLGFGFQNVLIVEMCLSSNTQDKQHRKALALNLSNKLAVISGTNLQGSD
jgi:hypothetical protein